MFSPARVLVLIHLGRLGFNILIELKDYRKGKHLTLHSKVALSITGFLIVFGTVGFMGLEWTNSLFLTIILMFIGASPGGTGGGIKTTTLAVLLLAVRSELRGESDIEAFGRRISLSMISRALAIVTLSMLLITMVTFILSLTEPHDFLDIFFETVSAFGTVGLSTGITPTLTSIGKTLIGLLMFVGRVGPITLALSLAKRQKNLNRRFAEEPLIVG